MKIIKTLKRNLRKTFAIAERNIWFEIRFKSKFIQGYISPITNFVIFFIIFGTIFSVNANYNFGYWNSNNYALFLLIGYIIQQIKSIVNKYDILFMREKFWKTLQGLLVAPFHRFNLLIGIVLSELILASIPIIVVFIIAYIFFPISIIQIIIFLLVLFSISIIFGSIGIFIGVFSISNESIAKFLSFSMRIIFAFSCVSYPLKIFPEIIQIFIVINPLFYLFDLLRLIWFSGINFGYAISYLSPIHIIILLSLVLVGPVIAIKLFNEVYKKLGITGY